jgi:hypothetical protein
MAAMSGAPLCPVCKLDMSDDPPLCPDCITARPQGGWPSPATSPPVSIEPTEAAPRRGPSAAPSAAPHQIRCPNPACLADVPADAGQCIYCGTTLGGRATSWALRIEGHRVTVPPEREVLLGRADESPFALVLAGRENVSRRHCEVRVRDALQVRDVGSTNGTFVDDHRLGSTWENMPDGSRLRLASNVVVHVTSGGEP